MGISQGDGKVTMLAVLKHAALCVVEERNAEAVAVVASAFAGGAEPSGCAVFPLVAARRVGDAVTLSAMDAVARFSHLRSVVLGSGAVAAAVVDAEGGSLTLFFTDASKGELALFFGSSPTANSLVRVLEGVGLATFWQTGSRCTAGLRRLHRAHKATALVVHGARGRRVRACCDNRSRMDER